MKFILLYGAPGTGKYTVAKELAALTGYTLFDNHIILNALSDVFGFHHPVRKKLEKEFRLRIIEEVAKADINIISTGVIMRDNEAFYRQMLKQIEDVGGECIIVHLTADREVIKSRIENESRKAMKKISTLERFEEWSQQYPESFQKIDFKTQYTFDTTNTEPQEIAKQIAKGI